MANLRYILFEYWPGIWLYAIIWIIFTVLVFCYLLSRSDCYSCSNVAGLLRSAILAAVITPSFMTEGFVVALPAPALMGFLFMAPAFFSPAHWNIIPAIFMLYILPWIICTGIIYFVWNHRRRQKNIEQSRVG